MGTVPSLAGGVGSKAELQQEVWDMAMGKVG